MPGTRKLGKTTSQRMAMLRQQVTDFLATGRMETTVTRCKEIAPLAEKMITLGKEKDLAAYRQALAFITREDVAKKVFDEIAPKYADRNGGYTRITRIGNRRGDADPEQLFRAIFLTSYGFTGTQARRFPHRRRSCCQAGPRRRGCGGQSGSQHCSADSAAGDAHRREDQSHGR